MIKNRKAFIVGLKSYKLSNKEKLFLKQHKPMGCYIIFKKYKIN